MEMIEYHDVVGNGGWISVHANGSVYLHEEINRCYIITLVHLVAPMMPEPQDSLSYGLSDIGFSKVEHVK